MLRAWNGDFDQHFVEARLDEVRRLIRDEELAGHPGIRVEPHATDNVYRQWADSYDDPGNALLELDLPFIDAILEKLPRGIAVDTGCGTGRLARRMAARGHQVLGVDTSVEMLQKAREEVPGIAFVLAAMNKLPLPDASIDLVTNALAMTHVADLHSVLTEWARVLRPGGSAIITDVHPDLAFLGSVPKAQRSDGQPQQASCHRHTVADYLRAALSAGFQIRRFDELPQGKSQPTGPPPVSAHEMGTWREWPWSLLGWVPEATRAAWDVPSMLAWHLELL